MTPAELHAILSRLGLSQAGAASLLRVNVRTMRRWMDGDIAVPFPVVALLRLLERGDIVEEQIEAISA